MGFKLKDYECLSCFFIFEDIEVNGQRATDHCPNCGDSDSTEIWIAPVVKTIGITHSKPFVSEQLGKKFNSNAEYRNFLASRPDLQPVEGSSQAWKNISDTAQNRADKAAQAMGYKDFQHRGEDRKKEKARERELKLNPKV